MATPMNTEEIGGMKIPKPQSNTYQQRMSVAAESIQGEAASMSHNTFRPDIYRVSEGYIS